LILLTAAAVVQTVSNPARIVQGNATFEVLHAAVGELMHVIVGFALAVLVHRLLPRIGLWIAIALAGVALYGAATHLRDDGMSGAHVWTGIPFGLLFGLAALDAIPPGVREAAAIDRAAGWFAFRTITLPLAAPLLLAGAVFLAAAALAPVALRPFVAAHALLIGAIAADGIVLRSRR
jgi:ABC-type glycerol-3-phosphate transport system permease component